MNLEGIIICTIAVGGLGIVLWVFHTRNRAKVNAELRAMPDHREDWLNSDIEPQAVDALLMLICEEFDFGMELRHRFAPTDTLMTIYHIEYPRPGTPDCSELEHIITTLEREFDVQWPKDANRRDSDPTLLEIAQQMDVHLRPAD